MTLKQTKEHLDFMRRFCQSEHEREGSVVDSYWIGCVDAYTNALRALNNLND